MMRLLVIRSEAELNVKGRAALKIARESEEREVPLRDIDAVLIIGEKVKIHAGVPPVLALHNIPLAILAKDYVSMLYNPVLTKYNNYRKLQYQLNRTNALYIAQRYVESKIQGMVNILKYYRENIPELMPPPEPVNDPDTYEREIRAWESLSSNFLWDSVFNLIAQKHREVLKELYKVTGRKPRSSDPFNKTLSTMYSVLYSLATKALLAAGLDPTYGFLHRTRYSTPLTFDYTEQFKPIAIQAAIDMINREGLPQIGEDGELTRESVNESIKWLYNYLTLKHSKTKKTPYQYIFLKAYRLAEYLEGRCPESRLAIVWDRRSYT